MTTTKKNLETLTVRHLQYNCGQPRNAKGKKTVALITAMIRHTTSWIQTIRRTRKIKMGGKKETKLNSDGKRLSLAQSSSSLTSLAHFAHMLT
jgi:hypothetical protein